MAAAQAGTLRAGAVRKGSHVRNEVVLNANNHHTALQKKEIVVRGHRRSGTCT